jgi:hypothetical protein
MRVWAADPSVTDIEMIVHEQDEWIINGKVFGRQDRCGHMPWTYEPRG